MAGIYYFYPDKPLASSGIRLLYRHVEILSRNGFQARMLHESRGFVMQDMPTVPTAYLSEKPLVVGDIVVIPEGNSFMLDAMKDTPLRLVVIALSWEYIYNTLPVGRDWRQMGAQHVITQSPFIGDFVSWSMGLPVTLFKWGINSTLYYPTKKKQPEIVYIDRKQDRMDSLKKVMRSRDAKFIEKIKWTPLEGLSETDYAATIQNAAIFLSLSRGEGLPASMLEAMRCRTLTAGYNSVGSQRELIGDGPKQNTILAPTLDYPELAMKLEPVLTDLINGDMSRYEPIIENAFAFSREYNRESEESSIIQMWRQITGTGAA